MAAATTRRAAVRISRWAKKAAELPGAYEAVLRDAPFAPQLARMVDTPPARPGWIHELKWDGYRIVGTVVAGTARLWSRNALEWTAKVPTIAKALEDLGLKSAAVDGELIAGTGSRADFHALQTALSNSGNPRGLTLVLFDLLHVDGVDIARAALIERKALLAEILGNASAKLAYSSHIPEDGAAALRLAGERDFEGIISKRGDSHYHAGRGDDWRKVKIIDSDEFAVVGYTPSSGSKIGFGSLLLAKPAPDGTWKYAGRVGTGFSDQVVRELRRIIGKRGGATPTIAIDTVKARELTNLRSAKWFEPLFVIEANVRGIGGSGLLRQASFKRLRLDKRLDDLRDSIR